MPTGSAETRTNRWGSKNNSVRIGPLSTAGVVEVAAERGRGVAGDGTLETCLPYEKQ